MTISSSDEAQLRHSTVRTALQSAEASCWGLYLLLPDEQPWHGLASGAFRLRVAALRERVDAASAALNAAEAAL